MKPAAQPIWRKSKTYKAPVRFCAGAYLYDRGKNKEKTRKTGLFFLDKRPAAL